MPPVAANDIFSTATVSAPGVLGNDSSPGGQSLTAIKVTNPSNGTVTLNANGSFTYTPNAGFTGTDSFTYKANNGSVDSNVATVIICPCSIWNSSAVPGTPAASDSGAVELGVKFRITQNGSIRGVRFYKGSGNTGTHVGKLWSSTGMLLASATFTGEPRQAGNRSSSRLRLLSPPIPPISRPTMPRMVTTLTTAATLD